MCDIQGKCMTSEPVEYPIIRGLSVFVYDIVDGKLWYKMGNPCRNSVYFACEQKLMCKQLLRDSQKGKYITIRQYEKSKKKVVKHRSTLTWTHDEFELLKERLKQ